MTDELGAGTRLKAAIKDGLSRVGTYLPGKAARIGFGIIVALVFVAIAAPLISPYAPMVKSGPDYAPPSLRHILGTDDVGEDLLSQLIWATRGSLLVAFLAGGCSAIVGTMVGLVSGYRGGKTDEGLMRMTDIVLTLPLLPLLIVLASIISPSIWLVIFVIGFLTWPITARVIRSQTITLRTRPFVDTAKLSGMRDLEIIFRTLLPNELPLVLAYGAFSAVGAVVLEVGLDFIGLGSISNLSWGVMLYFAESYNALLRGSWWWFLPPGLMVALLGTGFMLLGYGLRKVSTR